MSVRSRRVSLVRLCMHACMCIWCVFNCGYTLLSGSFDTEVYIVGIYMEVFSLHLRDHILIFAYINVGLG